MRLVLVLLAVLAGCATQPSQPPAPVTSPSAPPVVSPPPASESQQPPVAQPGAPSRDPGAPSAEPLPPLAAPEPAPAPPPTPAPQAPRESIAIAGLMETARNDAAAGRLVNAAASLERALRIEPRNPRLWHELARVRLKQGQYAQAESVAVRSNSWAGKDNALRAENWRLIAEARDARGDRAGAQAARDAAEKLK